jgi:hypothetical protein
MQTRKISVKIVLLISVMALLLINVLMCVILLSKNEEWKDIEKKKNVGVTSIPADALLEHVYYDGDSIPCNQIVRHYSRSGKNTGNEYFGDVLSGDKVVMLLSPNCCSLCVKDEINELLNVAKKIGREHLILVTDFALHTDHMWTMCFDREGYYETDKEHLGLKGSPTKETPVVMLTQNGRIKTSFVVGQQTSEFANGFHEYLIEYFKSKK